MFEIPAVVKDFYGSIGTSIPDGLILQTYTDNIICNFNDFKENIKKIYYVNNNQANFIDACINYCINDIDTGGSQGAHNLGCWYTFGKVVAQDFEKGQAYLKLASERGSIVSTGLLAIMYYSETDEKDEFLRLLHISAEGGFDYAQYELAHCYDHGRSGLTQDYAIAINWYCKAAEQGLSAALNNLADKYEYGKGVEQSYEIAIDYYHQAAKKDIPEAMFSLAKIFIEDKHPSITAEDAKSWLIKARNKNYEPANQALVEYYTKFAKLGDRLAMFELGQIYLNGSGKSIPINLEIAKNWLKKSAELNWLPAENLLKHLEDDSI